MTVADVGAGDGDFAVELARLVGEEGQVIATEVEEDKVRKLRALAEGQGIDNLGVVLGSQRGPGSTPAAATLYCCGWSTTTSRSRVRCAPTC